MSRNLWLSHANAALRVILQDRGRVVGKAAPQCVFLHVGPVGVVTFAGCRPASAWAQRLSSVSEITAVVWELSSRSDSGIFHLCVRAIVRTAVPTRSLGYSWTIRDLSSNILHWAPQSDACLCQTPHRGKFAPLNTSPSVFSYRGRPNGLSGTLLACLFLSLPPSLSLLQDVFVELGSLLFTHWVGWPPRVAAGCYRPPNRFFMCLGSPRSSWVWPVLDSQTAQGILGNQIRRTVWAIASSSELQKKIRATCEFFFPQNSGFNVRN